MAAMRALMLSLALLAGLAVVSAQSFEVASVKRSAAIERGGGSAGLQPGGRFVMFNGPTRVLLNMAFRTPTSEIVGAPDWVTFENYDVEARAGRDITREELSSLLRRLLAERFKLQAHLENRVRPVYELRTVRQDGQLGPAMRPSTLDCEVARACSTRGGGNTGTIESNGVSMASFVTWLPALAGRPVFDRTGLPGDYELLLKYSTSANDDAPVLPTALREQLGLALIPVDTATDVLVIDHIERPTEN